jgi:hypothetical protein
MSRIHDAVKMVSYFFVIYREIILSSARQNILCPINGQKIEKKQSV